MSMTERVPLRLPHPERGPGCTDNCITVAIVLHGVYGHREALLHDPAAHEEYGAARNNDRLVIGCLAVDRDRRRVWIDGTELTRMTAQEWRLLDALAARPGRIVPGSELLTRFWGPGAAGDHAVLRMAIMRLRERLGPAGRYVVNVLGRGYVLDDDLSLAPPARPVRWTRTWAACLLCGTTDYRHRARGYCNRQGCRARADAGARP